MERTSLDTAHAADAQRAEILASPNVARVAAALRAHGIAPAIVVLPAAVRTARAAADAIGCDVAQIANSLIFRRASGAPLLVMASGARRVDEARAAAAVGEAISKADAEFVRTRTGFPIGGVAPVGHLESIATLIEQSLAGFERIWAAGGHPNTVFELTPAELIRITGGTLVALSKDTAV